MKISRIPLIVGLWMVLEVNQCLSLDSFVNTCAKVAECLSYYESGCDSEGNRHICVTSLPLPGCVKTGLAPGNLTSIAGACMAFDTTTFRSVASFGTTPVTKPWAQNVPLCLTKVPGGSERSFGIRDHPAISSESQNVEVVGNVEPVGCSDYASVCDHVLNLDMQLTFKVGACPSNCTCSSWKSVGNCSVSCGYGTQLYEKECSGTGCLSPLTRTKRYICIEPPCKTDGFWSGAGPWSECTKACGGGIQQRSKVCTKLIGETGEASCPGSDTETKTCNIQTCQVTIAADPPVTTNHLAASLTVPVNGVWTTWSPYTTCSVTCGGGHKVRTRTCTEPSPANCGATCGGSSFQLRACNARVCRGCGRQPFQFVTLGN